MQNTPETKDVCRTGIERTMTSPEPYVDNIEAGKFLGLAPRTMNHMAQKGIVKAYPYGDGSRKTWRFRLSDLDAWMQSRIASLRRPLLPSRRRQ